jgi:gliding motility-associated-like protein
MKWIKTIFYILMCCTSVSATSQYITVNDTKSAIDLVNLLTNNSSCLNTSIETIKGDSYLPINNSYGSFDNNGSNFPITEGIILSTWASKNSIGPFTRAQGGGTTNWNGDSDLDLVMGIASINATILEFDFTPLTNFISFNYLFASNEYQDDFPCRFSDGFAFLIKDLSTSSIYQNLALIPGTNTPVSSMNIHPLISFTDTFGAEKGCQPVNVNYFAQLNTSSPNTSPINYSGQTIKLTAQSTVIPNHRYHIKLVIADDTVDTYDSAIFIEAGSFSSKIDLGQDQLIANNNPVCFGESVTLSTNLSGLHKWTRTDSSGIQRQLAETGSSLAVQDAGTYNVEANVATNCTVTGQIKIEYAPEISLKDTSLIKCDTNEDTYFDLTKAEGAIKNGNSSLTTFAYYETQMGTVLSNPITNPTSFIKTVITDQTVFAKVTTNTFGCTETAKITLQTIPNYELTNIPTTSPIVNDFSGNGNSVQLIPPTTTDTYEFSLDGKNYQLSPLFTNLAVGNYTAFIRNSGTCAYLTYPIYILDYPHFFTPNGDSYNELWKIKNLEVYPNTIITIFDRYGKLLKQLDSTSTGWNGTFNGYELPADDYWFSLNFDDGKIIKGHFSLKR